MKIKGILLTIVLSLISTTTFAQTFYSWRYRTHATDCTSLTDGKDKDLCYEQDSQQVFKCSPTTGDCDSSAEWKNVSGPWTDGGSNVYLSTTTDNVGIGTTNPIVKLDVVGGKAKADGVALKPPVTYTVCSSSGIGGDACDYVTDGTADNVEIQAALDALPSEGGKVFISEGTYSISSSITIGDNQILEGVGYGTYLRAATGLNAPVITEEGAGSGNSNLGIYRMRVDGNRANQTIAYSTIDLDNVTNSYLSDLYVQGGLRTGTFGVDASTNGEGIVLRNSNYNILSNINASFNDYDGIKLRNSDFNSISNTNCRDNGRSCIQIAFNVVDPPPASSSDYNSVSNTTAYFSTGTPDGASPTTSCVYIHGGSYNSVVSTSCYGARMAYGVDQGANYNVFSGGSLSTRGVGHPIVECASSAGTPAVGNIFTSNYFTAISGADKEYVDFDTACADNKFFGNSFKLDGGSGTWTVTFASGSTNNDYFNNFDDGNLSFSSTVAGANGINRLSFLSTTNYPGTMVYDGNNIWTTGLMFRNVGTSSTTSGGSIFLTQYDGSIMQSGERLGTVQFGGQDEGSDIELGATINSFADDNWTSTSSPGRLVFRTTPSGSLSPTEAMRIVSSGGVGIGTTNPSGGLEVKNSTFPGTRSIRSVVTTTGVATALSLTGQSSGDMTDGFGPNLNFEITDSGVGITNIANIAAVRDAADTSGKLIFQTYNTGTQSTKMVIGANGNVGIGTTNPQSLLQVASDARIGNGSFSNTSANEDLYVEGNLEVDGTIYGDGSGLTGIAAASGWSDGGTNVYVTTTTDNVGIGTTTPTATLLVENRGTSDSFRINDVISDSSPLIVNASGAVGIGTTTPTGAVDIRGDEVNIWTGAGTNTNATSSGELYVEGDLEVDGSIYGGGSGAFSISNSNVGIGTTLPDSLLTVASSGYVQFKASSAGAPTGTDCDADAERGRITIDTTNNRLYICNGATRAWDYISLTD